MGRLGRYTPDPGDALAVLDQARTLLKDLPEINRCPDRQNAHNVPKAQDTALQFKSHRGKGRDNEEDQATRASTA